MGADEIRLIDAFEDLLDRERALLLSGSLDGLSRILEEKAQLAARLGEIGGAPALAALGRKAERNARLLEAAGAGIRSVTRRIAALRDGPEPLSTYSASGRKTSLGGSGGSVERRA